MGGVVIYTPQHQFYVLSIHKLVLSATTAACEFLADVVLLTGRVAKPYTDI